MGNYITRDKVITKAVHDMIREMYLRAQPPIDINVYEEQYRQGILDKDKDRCYEWHYLPEPIQSQIVDAYLEAYNANDQMKYWFNWLKELFKDGGRRTVYEDIFGTGEKVRSSEPTEKLAHLIGEENAEKVYKLIDDFLGFYRTNHDEHSIRVAIFYCPTSNPKTVLKKWPDLKIDDSVYKGYDGEWDYTYHDYYNGEAVYDDDDDLIDEKQTKKLKKQKQKNVKKSKNILQIITH